MRERKEKNTKNGVLGLFFVNCVFFFEKKERKNKEKEKERKKKTKVNKN